MRCTSSANSPISTTSILPALPTRLTVSSARASSGGSNVFMVTIPGASADSTSAPASARLSRRAVISTSGSSGIHRNGRGVALCPTRADNQGGSLVKTHPSPRCGPALETRMRPRAAQQELRLTRALTLALARAGDFESGLRGALEVIGIEAGWDFGFAWVPAPGESRLAAGPVWPADEASPGLLERAASWDGPLWIENLAAEAEDPRARALLDAGFEAAFAVPVLARLPLFAALHSSPRRATPEDAEVMEVISVVASPLGAFL